MSIRGFLLENFAGDLEYHPRRAMVYFCLAAGAGTVWIFSSPESKFTTMPLVLALGGLALFGKGVFLFRKSSEGLGLSFSYHQRAAVSQAAERKELPPLPAQAAQVLQDFGIGGLLLWPLLSLGPSFNYTWTNPPRGPVVLVGGALFGLGWLIRQATMPTTDS